jgi:hypothetical protein
MKRELPMLDEWVLSNCDSASAGRVSWRQVPKLFFFEFPARMEMEADPQEVCFMQKNAVEAHNYEQNSITSSFIFIRPLVSSPVMGQSVCHSDNVP